MDSLSSQKDSKEVVKTRLAAMGTESTQGISAEHRDMGTSMSVFGERDRPPLDVMKPSNGSQFHRDKRLRADALRAASVADMEVVKRHAQWRNPELESRVDATQPSAVEGVGAAIFARYAD